MRRHRRLLLVSSVTCLLVFCTGVLPAIGGNPVGELVQNNTGDPQVFTPLTTDPKSSGQWQVLSYRTPSLAVHSAVLPKSGMVLLVTGSSNNPDKFAAGDFKTTVWDPSAGTFTTVLTPTDVFCGGHAHLPDGNVLVAGGTLAYQTDTRGFEGAKNAYVFNSTTLQYEPVQSMSEGRWYPTAVALGTGNVLFASGHSENVNITGNNEMWNVSTKSWQPANNQFFPTYPHLVLMKDGRLFYSGENGTGRAVDPGIWKPTGTKSFTVVGGLDKLTSRVDGATILLPPAQKQKVLVIGGGPGNNGPALADTKTVDLTAASPTYTAGPSLPAGKIFDSAVILPDGTVLETGGASSFYGAPIQETSIYNPTTGLFTLMNPPSVPRVYHSEAFLLPDGRVATVGGNPGGAPDENRIEIYSPPYLFKGVRPKIIGVPTELEYGGTVGISTQISDGAKLTAVRLIRPAATTHQNDSNQRSIDLTFAAGSATGGKITVPGNHNLAPPGWYMLFAVDGKGRPSLAKWVHLTTP